MEVCCHGVDSDLSFNYPDAVRFRQMVDDLSIADAHVNYDAYFSTIDGVCASPYFEKTTPEVVECLN